jgi:hypothetical protein
VNVIEQATEAGTAAGRLKAAGLPYVLPRYTLRDEMVIRRRCASYWWAAFAEAAHLPPLPSQAEMAAIDAADPG